MPTLTCLKKTTALRLPSALGLLALAGWNASLGQTAESAAMLSLKMDHGSPKLQIRGSAGQWVQVQYRSALDGAGPWRTLTSLVLDQSDVSLTDSAAPGQVRFYQIAAVTQTPLAVGTFTMGSAASEDGRDYDEGPQTQVTLTKAFWMSPHEVTQGEFAAIMGSNPSSVKGDEQQPVEQVTWTEAQTYCQKLTQQERGAGRIPASFAYRLPTEAEWEYAARAGTTTRFSYGNDPNYTQLSSYAWFAADSGGAPHDVATALPNAWGLYDMAGNVWEWCQDWYAAYPGGSVTDPAGPVTGTERVVRGGSYYYDGWLCRSATRSPQIGFRVVLAPE